MNLIDMPLDETHRESIRSIRRIRQWVRAAHDRVAEWDLPEYRSNR